MNVGRRDQFQTLNLRTEKKMRKFGQALVKFLKNEDGPTAVEYAVMLALIIVVCITAITTLGTNANTTFTTVGTKSPVPKGTEWDRWERRIGNRTATKQVSHSRFAVPLVSLVFNPLMR